MNKPASILFIPSSFYGGRVKLNDSLTTNRIYQLIHASCARTLRTGDVFQLLERQLAHLADHALDTKQADRAEEVTELMLGLPTSEQFRGNTRYYQAECLRRRGDFDGARGIAALAVGTATPGYRARALQCIGATYCDSGEYDEAARFFIAAGKIAVDCDPVRFIRSQSMLAIIRSIHGDHKRALNDLENLFSLLPMIAKQHPATYFDYLNSLAVELGEVGRIDEAHRVLDVALSSPFASAYPNWAETREELEEKCVAATPSVVAVTCVPEATKPETEKSKTVQTKPKLRLAKVRGLLWLQITTCSPPKKRPIEPPVGFHPLITFGLDRLGDSIKPRAPPSRT